MISIVILSVIILNVFQLDVMVSSVIIRPSVFFLFKENEGFSSASAQKEKLLLFIYFSILV